MRVLRVLEETLGQLDKEYGEPDRQNRSDPCENACFPRCWPSTPDRRRTVFAASVAPPGSALRRPRHFWSSPRSCRPAAKTSSCAPVASWSRCRGDGCVDLPCRECAPGADGESNDVARCANPSTACLAPEHERRQPRSPARPGGDAPGSRGQRRVQPGAAAAPCASPRPRSTPLEFAELKEPSARQPGDAGLPAGARLRPSRSTTTACSSAAHAGCASSASVGIPAHSPRTATSRAGRFEHSCVPRRPERFRTSRHANAKRSSDGARRNSPQLKVTIPTTAPASSNRRRWGARPGRLRERCAARGRDAWRSRRDSQGRPSITVRARGARVVS